MRILIVIAIALMLSGCGYGFVIGYWADQWQQSREVQDDER